MGSSAICGVSEKPIKILILSDGKPGHVNQSLGLAEAMQRRDSVEILRLEIDVEAGWWKRVRKAIADASGFKGVDFVISAGHGTHLSLVAVSRKLGAKSIVLMKPGLPLAWFDWCIAPEHDFKGKPPSVNLILSRGALNRVVPASGVRSGKLFLIGGPSKLHGYDEAALIGQMVAVAGDEMNWEIADSRRTPESFHAAVMERLPAAKFTGHGDTSPGWLAEKLGQVSEVQITEDSVSMIYEGLSSGAQVSVLDMPRKKKDARVLRGLEKLKADGYFREEKEPLREADRCVEIILSRG